MGEWIHKAYELSRHGRARSPLLGLVGALEQMLAGPEAFLSAFEPLLTADDPWVRALARLQMGKQRIMVGRAGQEVDTYLEEALAEFRALGERWGMSFALTELADRIAMRGKFADACALIEQAVTVVTEVGAVDDVVRMRSRQAQLYWLLGDASAGTAALAEA
ncbi:AfsR/SARP family transcriptional regulator, partial [Nocardia gipuzkoensis]